MAKRSKKKAPATKRSRRRTSGTSFSYKKRDAATVRKRAEQQGGGFASYTKDGLPTYKPGNSNRLRILPPTHEDAEHYGIDIFVVYNVGPDGDTYLSLDKMGKGDCPLAEELNRAQREGEDEQYIKDLKPKKRVLMWVIDRDKEAEGPKLWAAPWTVDRDIASACQSKRTGEVLYIDHPDEGYDIEFDKSGEKLHTKYGAFKADRESTPLSDDPKQQEEWLQFVLDNPLPDCLNFYDYDHIKSKLEATGPSTADDEEDAVPATRRGRKGKAAAPTPTDEPEEWDEDEDLEDEGGEGEEWVDPEEEEEDEEELEEEDEEELEEEDEDEDELYIPAKGDRVSAEYDGVAELGTVTKVVKSREVASVDFDDDTTAEHGWDELTLLEDEEPEDEEWEEEPEEDEEPEDEEPEDEEWEEEPEEETPKPKPRTKGKPKPKPRTKGKAEVRRQVRAGRGKN